MLGVSPDTPAHPRGSLPSVWEHHPALLWQLPCPTLSRAIFSFSFISQLCPGLMELPGWCFCPLTATSVSLHPPNSCSCTLGQHRGVPRPWCPPAPALGWAPWGSSASAKEQQKTEPKVLRVHQVQHISISPQTHVLLQPSGEESAASSTWNKTFSTSVGFSTAKADN